MADVPGIFPVVNRSRASFAYLGAVSRALVPSRQRLVLRLSLGAAALLVTEALLVVFWEATDALVLTVPMLGILVASWYGGISFGLLGLALTATISLGLGATQSSELLRLATLVPTAVFGFFLVELLRHSADEAARIARERDEFVSLVSHELRNPVFVVVGNARALQTAAEALEPEVRQQALRDIVESGERLDRIVTGLLAVGRIAQGNQIDTEPVLLRRLANRLVNEHRQYFPNRDVRLTVSGDPAPVLGNELLLLLIIRNLLGNAEKFSPPEQPVELTVERLSDTVRVRVRDHGTGLPPGQGERIFEPFYRSAASRPAEGVGVGLTVCWRLVEALQGRIWACNHDDGGAVFSFELPIVPADEDV